VIPRSPATSATRQPDDARHWYERAAQAGDVGAMVNLGILLADQLDPPESDEARRWYGRAADAGDAVARARLDELLRRPRGW
jgi:TPR repeat protein